MSDESNEHGGVYPTTHWTQIFQARELDKTSGRNALGEMLTRYRAALLRHLTWKFRTTPEQAEDWLQSFVERKVLEYQLLRQADRERGRFRTFLLSALDHFVRDEIEKGQARKRRPEEGFVPLVEAADTPADTASVGGCDPGDVEWARGVLARSVRQTRQWYECQANRKTWTAFQMARIGPLLEGHDRPSDQQIAEKCGLPVAQVSNTINNAARKFRTELRRIIREYASSDVEVDEELSTLIGILRKAG